MAASVVDVEDESILSSIFKSSFPGECQSETTSVNLECEELGRTLQQSIFYLEITSAKSRLPCGVT